MIHWGHCLKTHWNVLITTYVFVGVCYLAYINSIAQLRRTLTFTWYDDEELLVYALLEKTRCYYYNFVCEKTFWSFLTISSIFRKEKTQNHNTLVVSVIIQLVQPRCLNERKIVASVEMEARNKWIGHFPLIWSWSWANRKKGGEVKQRRDSLTNWWNLIHNCFIMLNNYYYLLLKKYAKVRIKQSELVNMKPRNKWIRYFP